MKIHTTSLSLGALAASLVLAGCGSGSKPAAQPAAAAAAAGPARADAIRRRSVLRHHLVHHAGGLRVVGRRQAAARQLGRDRHLQPVRIAGRGRRQAAADVFDDRFDVRRVLVSGRSSARCSPRTAAATRSIISTCAKRTAQTRDLTPGDKAKAEFFGWSADKQHFFVTTNERDAQGVRSVPVRDEGLSRTLVFKNDAAWQLAELSPDDRYLALVKPRTSADSDVYLVDLATKKHAPQLITKHEGNVTHDVYAFTRDSKQLVYATDELGEFNQAWTYDLAGGAKTPLITRGLGHLVRRVFRVRPLSHLGRQRGRAHGGAHPRHHHQQGDHAAGSAGGRSRAGALLARRVAAGAAGELRHFAERRVHDRPRRPAQRAPDARAQSEDQGSGPGRDRGRALSELRRPEDPVDPVSAAHRIRDRTRCRRWCGCTADPAARAAAATRRRSSTW